MTIATTRKKIGAVVAAIEVAKVVAGVMSTKVEVVVAVAGMIVTDAAEVTEEVAIAAVVTAGEVADGEDDSIAETVSVQGTSRLLPE